MRRRLLTLATALSLLLFSVVLLLWVWTARRLEAVSLTRGMRTWSVTSFAGGITFLQLDRTFMAPGTERVSQAWPAGVPTPPAGWVRPLIGVPSTCGFVFARTGNGGLNPCEPWGPNLVETWKRASARVVAVPYWFLCTCFAVPLLRKARTIAAYLLVAKRAPGCCRCGYDLRATRCHCPECGTPVRENRGAHMGRAVVFASVVSVLLAGCVAVSWGMSFMRADRVVWKGSRLSLGVSSSRGELALRMERRLLSRHPWTDASPFGVRHVSLSPAPEYLNGVGHSQFLGFGWMRGGARLITTPPTPVEASDTMLVPH